VLGAGFFGWWLNTRLPSPRVSSRKSVPASLSDADTKPAETTLVNMRCGSARSLGGPTIINAEDPCCTVVAGLRSRPPRPHPLAHVGWHGYRCPTYITASSPWQITTFLSGPPFPFDAKRSISAEFPLVLFFALLHNIFCMRTLSGAKEF
jgi:hypothetical protein